jgi:hypothetical protein
MCVHSRAPGISLMKPAMKMSKATASSRGRKDFPPCVLEGNSNQAEGWRIIGIDVLARATCFHYLDAYFKSAKS